eukprot:COSAG02_NODE_18860_length_913_cov_1.628993_1_plen_30_part_01
MVSSTIMSAICDVARLNCTNIFHYLCFLAH